MDIGFIILRCVKEPKVNKYWQLCYDSIRHFYPESPIVIIDDCSNPDMLTDKSMTNTTIVNSEFPGRGEVLPYYYYQKNRWFPRAMIIHDSIVINSKLDLNFDRAIMLWHFKHNWDQPEDEIRILSGLKDPVPILQFHSQKDKWNGCSGGQCLIELSFLDELDSKYDLKRLVDLIQNRFQRMSFERVWATLLCANMDSRMSLFGDIHDYMDWGISFDQINAYAHLPIIKYWSGR